MLQHDGDAVRVRGCGTSQRCLHSWKQRPAVAKKQTHKSTNTMTLRGTCITLGDPTDPTSYIFHLILPTWLPTSHTQINNKDRPTDDCTLPSVTSPSSSSSLQMTSLSLGSSLVGMSPPHRLYKRRGHSHYYVTYLFVDCHFEASSLVFWPLPTWFVGARSDVIWTWG